MPSVKPIKLYLEALEAYNQGNKASAAQKLALSLGADEPSSVIINSIKKLLTNDTMPNDAILQIISTEVSKKRNGQKNLRG